VKNFVSPGFEVGVGDGEGEGDGDGAGAGAPRFSRRFASILLNIDIFFSYF
jgi:hypothetical protein